MHLRRTSATAICVVLCAGGVGLVSALPSNAVHVEQDRIVSDNPTDSTPHVIDGMVRSIVKIGGRVFVGGDFTQVKAAGSNTILTRNNLFSFTESTGAIDSWNPNADAGVYAMVPASDGQSIYVGGRFSHVNGVSAFVLARLNLTTGAKVAGFAPSLDARVNDLKLSGGRLYVAGAFATVGGVARSSLATLNPTTGARDDFVDLNIAGTHNGGTTQLLKMDITPDGSRLVGIGNFATVDGFTDRQLFMADLTGPTASVANWHTTRYAATCSSSFNTYMRDVDISPDGTYMVVTTTGAPFGTTKLCDTTSRWEVNISGSNLQPSWVNWSGGDTMCAVAITGPAVYVGGHFRWSNNPFGSDTPGQGAISREGIKVVDPINGMPFAWNPGRTKGICVFDLLPTSDGLYVGSDTDILGGETHMKLGKFPLAGGEVVPAWNTGTLPGNVYLGGDINNNTNFLRHRSFDGSTAGAIVNDPTFGLDWRRTRGAFMINGKLYYGWDDGSFFRRDFDGATLGAPTSVNLSDQITFMADWHGTNGVRSIRGMFYYNGRIYYVRGTTNLHYRYLNPESDAVGAMELTATGGLSDISWSNVRGMFVNGNHLYWVSNSDGFLRRSNFVNGMPIGGTATVVSTSDWRARSLFLFSGIPNVPPQASFSSNCTGLTCGFDASASNDPDGSIVSYAWDFGDGNTGSGVAPNHTYAAAGTYTVQLTVTDNRGGTDTQSQQVTVGSSQVNIDFVGTAGFNANTTSPTVTIPSAVQAGDGLIMALTMNSTAVTVSGPTGVTGWTQLGTQTAGTAVSTYWRKVATSGDAGQSVGFTFSDFAKGDLQVFAYSGTNETNPVAAFNLAVDPVAVTAHTTPTATVSQSGSWALSYWADKSSSTTAWIAPGGVTVRSNLIGSGGGRITSLVADSGGTVATGSYGGLTASTDFASRAFMATIILARE